MEWLRALDVRDVAQKLWAPRRTKVAVIVVLAGGLFVFKWVSVRAEVRTRIFHRRIEPGFPAFRAYPFRWLLARSMYYPWITHRLLMKHYLRPYWWSAVDETVILGALPVRPMVEALHAVGVRGVVNCCEEYDGSAALYAKYGMRQLRIPTIDFTCPTLEQLEEAIAFIKDCKARGEKVYVHCKAGKGRSATVVLCYLMDKHAQAHLRPKSAQIMLQQKRYWVTRTLYKRETVREFYRRRMYKATLAHATRLVTTVA